MELKIHVQVLVDQEFVFIPYKISINILFHTVAFGCLKSSINILIRIVSDLFGKRILAISQLESF